MVASEGNLVPRLQRLLKHSTMGTGSASNAPQCQDLNRLSRWLGISGRIWAVNPEFLSELETCMESNSAAPHDPRTLSSSISGVHISGRKHVWIVSAPSVHKSGYWQRSLPCSSLAPRAF